MITINNENTLLFNSSNKIFVSLIDDNTGQPITGATPSLYIRRDSDGYFFDGAVFVDTANTPTALPMIEISQIAIPGMYSYTFNDPGVNPIIIPQLTYDIYQLRCVSGSLVALNIRRYAKELRDINTQGL